MPESKPRARSAHEIVLEKIRQSIVDGELKPGTLYSIYQLAEELGVSRTPVREAVLNLADAGMLTIERNRGIRVRGLSVRDLYEIFDLRLLLEVPSAARAARINNPELTSSLYAHLGTMRDAIRQRDVSAFAASDRALHTEILLAGGNGRLLHQVNALRDATQAMGASTVNESRGAHQIEQEHVPIVQAIAAANPVAAAAAMRVHLIETGLLLMKQIAAVTGETLPDPWQFADDQHS